MSNFFNDGDRIFNTLAFMAGVILLASFVAMISTDEYAVADINGKCLEYSKSGCITHEKKGYRCYVENGETLAICVTAKECNEVCDKARTARR